MLRTLAKTNSLDGLLAYGEYVFGYQPEPHHREMLGTMLDSLYRRVDTEILMPAGAAKSTWGNTIFGSWVVSMFPNVRIGLFSQTGEFAESFSGAIMATLETNEKQLELFGDLSHGRKWTLRGWHRKGSVWEKSKDFTVFAGGTGGQVASKRFDLLLCDDLLGKDNTATVDQREATKEWWDKSLYPRVVADGVSIVFGTRWEDGDLYQTLGNPLDDAENPGYGFRTHIIQAMIETTPDDPRGMLYPDSDPPVWFRSYWESNYPIKTLISWRQRNPDAFDCTYQQDIAGLLSGDKFQRRWWQHHYFTELPAGDYTIRIGVDLAFSEKTRADFTACVIVAEQQGTGDYYVIGAFRDKMKQGHGEWIDSHYENPPSAGERTLRISAVNIEEVQAQSMLVNQMMTTYPHMPVVGLPADKDKVSRATPVAEKYRMGKVYHHARLRNSDFERELTGFPKGHDDWVDALGYAMNLGGGSFFFGSLRPGSRN